jgi:hypothetical protein
VALRQIILNIIEATLTQHCIEYFSTYSIAHCTYLLMSAQKKLLQCLRQSKLKYFKVSYSAEYKTFVPHHILSDPLHPLYQQRLREQNKRKREGLWWHATTGLDLSKSSVVRSWCRRRIRDAFVDLLKKRGFDEFGKLVDTKALEEGRFKQLAKVLKTREDYSLTGSFRFHAEQAVIPAKFVHIQQELSLVVDAMLDGALIDLAGVPVDRRAATTQPLPNSIPPKWKHSNRNSQTPQRTEKQKRAQGPPFTAKWSNGPNQSPKVGRTRIID